MTQALTLDEFKRLAKTAKRVAVFREVPAGTLAPIDVYELLNESYGENGVMTDNLREEESLRYSYICFKSIASLTINHGENKSPLAALRNLQAQFAFVTSPTVASQITGAMGIITYDTARYFEDLPSRHPANPLLPVLLFNFYSISVTFDHKRKTILISRLVEVSAFPEQDHEKAEQEISEIIQVLSSESRQTKSLQSLKKPTEIDVDITDADFMRKVETAKDYIAAGEAFQIVLSRCFKRQYTVSPLEIYKTLCRVSPSPFMFYFPTETTAIVGASPERMISIINREVRVNPIAGTRKRKGDDSDQDTITELLNDEKELAEHMMLVDLARNDVGAVSEPGSVVVSEFLQVKQYSHVIHMASSVTGKLQDKYDVFDAFAAAFPAGTLSGAPKIRAMEIIDELETSQRGLYGGAICRIDSLGNFDSCIAIRMAVLQDGLATIRVGAGIVHDSIPASEARETTQKAQSMLHAIAEAHGEQYDFNY